MNPKISLLFALAAVLCFVLTGIFIAEKSILGVLLSLVAAVLVIGFGFMLKKRARVRQKN